MICKSCGNHIFLTDEDNLPDVWSHLEETNCDDPVPLLVVTEGDWS